LATKGLNLNQSNGLSKKATPLKGVAFYIAVNLAVRPLFTSKTKNKNLVYKSYNTTNQ
jgi:hypothetical protein